MGILWGYVERGISMAYSVDLRAVAIRMAKEDELSPRRIADRLKFENGTI
jgi:hypothetical protein